MTHIDQGLSYLKKIQVVEHTVGKEGDHRDQQSDLGRFQARLLLSLRRDDVGSGVKTKASHDYSFVESDV
jgi:hypothetical protein